MNRVSMALKPEEKGKSDGCCCSAPCDCGEEGRPRYPWGLQLNVENDQLDALNVKDLPKAGSTMIVECMVKVTDCHISDREGAEPERRVTLQIIEMGLGGVPMTDKEKAATMYDKSKGMEEL